MHKYITIIFLFLAVTAFPQAEEKLLRLEGRIVDSRQDPIPYANIIVVHQGYGVAGDMFGSFSIGAYPGDTLQVSALSYHKARFIVPPSAEDLPSRLVLTLVSDTIMLAEQEVYAWKERDEQLKVEIEKLIDQELITTYNLLTPSYGDLFKNQFKMMGMGVSMPGPFSLIYSTFSKEAKIRRALEKIIIQEAVRKRYNDALITRVTGIRDKLEINTFVWFCDLDDQFVLQASDYELIAAVRNCYKAYCQNN